MKESQIFSKIRKKEDILKNMRVEEDKKNGTTYDANFGEKIENDEKINIKEYSDLIDEFSAIFLQDDINKLNNDKKIILDYFYIGELQIERYITNIYNNNDNKRHLYIRIADYLLRVQFEENESICKTTKKINDLILQVNESYSEQNNLNDLSDKTYLEKISNALGTKAVPSFLLREGYRLRRQLQKNKEFILGSMIKLKENKKDIEYNNKHYSDKENVYSTDEQSEQYSINNIIKEIENKKKLPFDRDLSEIYLMIFFLSLKEARNEEIYKTIKNNLIEFTKYFKIESELNYNDFKEKYIDFNDKELPISIFDMEFSKINESEYLCKYILASYYILINKILRSQNGIYINLLLYLQKYIKQENGLLLKIIENEINNALLSDSKDDKYNNKCNIKKSNTFKALNFLFKKNNENTHTAKSFDYDSIKKAFKCSNDNNLKERFYEVIKEEESYEIGSNSFFLNVLKLFEPLYKLKKPTKINTIKNHLKLIPYQKNIEGKNILILISGYLSSKSEHSKEWSKLIEVYKKKYTNPIIYFFNWPSSEIKLNKILYHWKDFKDARERGKYCGRLLALMMMSNFFKDVEINIAAFSLGNHVLKHCIKELEKFGRLDILNNIIFMAGATDIKCNDKWEQRLSSIKGNVINCYSNVDLALVYCKIITGKDTIGTKILKFKNKIVKNYLINSFHVLYRINMDIIGQFFIDDLKN